MPNPSSLPEVKSVDFPSPVDWSDKSYVFEQKDAMIESLNCCYYNPPKEDLNWFKFVYKIDSPEQTQIKTDAASSALDYTMQLYNKNYKSDPNYVTHHQHFYGQMHTFFVALGRFIH